MHYYQPIFGLKMVGVMATVTITDMYVKLGQKLSTNVIFLPRQSATLIPPCLHYREGVEDVQRPHMTPRLIFLSIINTTGIVQPGQKFTCTPGMIRAATQKLKDHQGEWVACDDWVIATADWRESGGR